MRIRKNLLPLLVFLSVLSPVPSFAGLTDPSLKWRTIETAHFSIHYYEGEEQVASRLAVVSEEVYETLSRKFDARPWGKTEVVLVDNHDLANGFTQVIPYNHVLLRVVPPEADSLLADYDDWLRELFIHEYTHVIHLSDTRYPAKLLKMFLGKLVAPNGLSPGWVTEGIATYFETAETTRGRGRSSFADMLFRTAILRGRFLKLDQMAGTQFDWPSWMAQYLYGVGFWQYLADTYGEEKITEFSHKYGASLWFFSLNNKARRVFKKGFYRLWRDWKGALEERYALVRERVEKEGLREGEVFLEPRKGESFSLPTLSPDGMNLVYQATSVHHPQELRLKDLETGKEKILLKKRDIQQASFSPDGKRVVVSNVGIFKKYYQYSDLHEVDLETGKVKKLTKGKRAREPDFSPDGRKIVAVLIETGSMSLAVYDTETEGWTDVAKASQFDSPRWLPDGRSVVVSAHRKGQRDVWIIDTKGGKERRISSDVAVENGLTVDRRRRAVYYSSDRTGISNIYRYDLKNGRTRQVTNVLTGAFSPTVSPDGTLVFQYYNGKGFEIRRQLDKGRRAWGGSRSLCAGASENEPEKSDRACELEIDRGRNPTRKGETDFAGRIERAGAGSEQPPQSPPSFKARNYRPFKRLFVPRYIFPNAALLDNAIFLSATIGSYDPIYRHIWYGDVTFRSDNQFIGFDAGYTYNRFRIPFSVGFGQFSVNYGDVFGLGADFFEERKRGFAGASFPVGPSRFSLSYFFENRSEESGLPAGTTLMTLGNYAGFFAQYSFRRSGGTTAQISQEEGGKFTVNFEMTNSLFGSSGQLEQEVIWGDARTYLRVPIAAHHVLALRAAGGTAFGDQLLQGNFGLGGSVGEGPFTGTSTRVFTLRGLPLVTFSRDRVWVASAEYRMPLFRFQRGLGTLPFAMNSAHFALFADIGDAFNRGNPSFRPLLGVGGELRGDFVIGYHLPVVGRLGYGIIVTNRDRIAGVTDSLTGADARNGVVILELGTSF